LPVEHFILCECVFNWHELIENNVKSHLAVLGVFFGLIEARFAEGGGGAGQGSTGEQ